MTNKQKIESLCDVVIKHGERQKADWKRIQTILLNQVIKDLLYEGHYTSDDIRELLQECVEEVDTFMKMINEPDMI